MKKTIVLHHTAGGTAKSSIDGWNNDATPVATCVTIDRDGKIWQAFPSTCWAFSLGLTTPNYRQVEQQSIAVELASYGGLQLKDGKYYNAYGSVIKKEQVIDLGKPFRGFQYYEAYTDEQIESLRLLLVEWQAKYSIDLFYNEAMWDYSPKAVAGAGGLWTHVSYRKDKSDCYPNPKLIEMLKGLRG